MNKATQTETLDKRKGRLAVILNEENIMWDYLEFFDIGRLLYFKQEWENDGTRIVWIDSHSIAGGDLGMVNNYVPTI